MMRRPLIAALGAALAVQPLPLASAQTSAPRAERSRPAAPPATPGIFVSAAHPLAVEAGLDVLRRGGSAADAAVAVQVMLGLVEPQSSGVGGGGFLMYYDAATKRVSAWSGRERAPKAATPDMLLQPDGAPIPRRQAMLSGRATGVPGVMSMLHAVHQRSGTLAWSSLFESTARTAEQGFTVTERLNRHIIGTFPQASAPDVVAFFTKPDGTKVTTGDTLKNPAYAAFLRRLARQGPDALLKGETAARIVEKVRQGPYPGVLTLDDLASYQPQKLTPLCRVHVRIICAPPPPASGVGLLHLLGLLDRTDIAQRGPNDPQAWYLFAEASRIMYADRDRWVGDPDFTQVPVAGLLHPDYIAARAKLIGEKAGKEPPSGRPPGSQPVGKDATREPAGTSHFVIVDAKGNAISMTTTIESYFGSGRMVDGFFLNNEMTDFSFRPIVEGTSRPSANAVAGGRRPRSSMTPVLILDRDNNLVGAVGSPGGNAIPAYVAKTLVGVLYWNLPMQAAIDLPNLVARDANFNGEVQAMLPPVAEGLRARGVDVRSGSGEDSGIHGFMIRNGAFDGGADRRRDGVAVAEPVPK
ncbi:gamma-glutamyltransferase family protein [Sphingomonas sp.]|uniref:gamma-glutamyltransferase family protein n=1 Tax=Sphingomonas sp. TaxID=28214 RepID=UPI0017C612BA|nr:gamma-glutamyltransferase family protein [Sphingomonas sp.]MBA4761186.1 gamma-glutamyltransferase family protein [Sphingomonas sp.]